MYSLTHSYLDGLMMSYFIQWVIICYYLLFNAQTVSYLASENPFILTCPPPMFPSSSEPFLTVCCDKMLQVHVLLSRPSPRLSRFHKEPWFLEAELATWKPRSEC